MDLLDFGSCQVDLDKIHKDQISFLFESASMYCGYDPLVKAMFAKCESPIEVLFLIQWIRCLGFEIGEDGKEGPEIYFEMLYEKPGNDGFCSIGDVVRAYQKEDNVVIINVYPQYKISGYRLDFCFMINKTERNGGMGFWIDVELDGQQHEDYDQWSHDMKREGHIKSRYNLMETIRIPGRELWSNPIKTIRNLENTVRRLTSKWRGDGLYING